MEMTGWFRQAEVQTVISLWPSALADVRGRVRRQLDGLLMLYNAGMAGVPVAYTRAQARSRTASIHEDSPLVHVDVTALFTVFAPKPGMRLHGTVNKITPDHVGLLVLGVFNASIPRDSIPASYEYDPESESWTEHGFDSPSLGAGTQVAFNVVSIEAANGVISLVGEIKSENTG
jgi:DNA-directed RNA polymerase I subunit RPA43